EKHCRKLQRPLLEMSRAAIKWLQSRPWPGNVSALEGVTERSVIQSPSTLLQIEEDQSILRFPPADAPTGPIDGGALSMQEAERRHIVATLERVGWRIEGPGGAAEALALNASTLRSR